MLHVHRAERADALVVALGDLLLEPAGDPLAPEVVSVPTRGMERWLTQRLSERLGTSPGRADGICANVDFPFPRRMLGDAVAAASGIEPDADPWLPERAVWPLLEVVDASLDEPWLGRLAVHLGRGADPADPVRAARRFAVVRHLAELFDRYALHRPAMLAAWAAGRDEDGEGRPLRENAEWQAELWRRLRARIDAPGPAERRERACARLREEPGIVGLPERLAVFGLTRLPAGHLAVLRALAARRDVHRFLLHPSPALWDAVAGELARGLAERDGAATLWDDPAEPARRPIHRGEDPTAKLPANPLLASWGRDAREMQLVLGAAGDRVDHHHPLDAGAGTLLARLQADIRADRRPPGPIAVGGDDERPVLDPDDRSLRIHACHGRARQVEVLRDEILHVLAEDPALEPRDVIVMCPDIEAFAPLIHASFGAGEVAAAARDDPAAATPGPVDLRVRLADRSLRQTNPLLGAVAALLDLAGRRLTASEVLDFADREPVRRRFRFDDDDLTRIESWVAESGIRWGLDDAHRAPFALAGLGSGTWRFGLDRLLAGVTMAEDEPRVFADVLPFDDVDSERIELAGRLAELVDRLGAAIDALQGPQPVAEWTAALSDAAAGLTATAPREVWQRVELDRLLADVTAEATRDGAAAGTPLALGEVRALLEDRLAGRATRANFRTGHLTVCTLMPMRSVPHRVVCLLGLDDGAFPRKAPRDGDDLMLDDPHVGERDPRSEDRQLLLDALLAARDRLVITYTGNDERTNVPRPPAVPVGELLDAVDATVRSADGRRAREHVVVRHPLQPFDPRNFTPGELVPGRIWSFDEVTLEGARALAGERDAPGPFLRAPLEPLDTSVVEVEDLVQFVSHPVRAFLRRRLGISLWEREDDVEDGLRVELDGLQTWQVGERVLQERLAGIDGEAAVRAEQRRGTLPPGALGVVALNKLYPPINALVAAVERIAGAAEPAPPVDVRLALPDGRRLGGTVAGVRGDVLLSATYSRLKPRHRLAAWVRLLALSAARPERPFSAAVVARAPERDHDVAVVRIGPLAAEPEARRRDAIVHLLTLFDLFARGMREPLPLYHETSAAFAEAARDGVDPVAAAARPWSEDRFDAESTDPAHRLVHGGEPPLVEVLGVPRPDEQGGEWEPDEPTRLGRYARRLWDPLLAFEEIEYR